MGIFKKRINDFPTPYTVKAAVTKGGIETKLSMLVMGLGNIVHKQLGNCETSSRFNTKQDMNCENYDF